MRKRFGAALAALAFGFATLGGSAAGADQANHDYHGRWLTVTDVCGADRAAPAESTGTWSLAVKRDGAGTFTFDYRRLDWPPDQRVTGTIVVGVISRRPLTASGLFSGPFGAFTMTLVVHHDDVVLVSTTQIPCDEAGQLVLSPVFVGTVT